MTKREKVVAGDNPSGLFTVLLIADGEVELRITLSRHYQKINVPVTHPAGGISQEVYVFSHKGKLTNTLVYIREDQIED